MRYYDFAQLQCQRFAGVVQRWTLEDDANRSADADRGEHPQ